MDLSSPRRVRNPITLAGELPPLDVPQATEPDHIGASWKAKAPSRARVPDHWIMRAIFVLLVVAIGGVLVILHRP